MNQIQLLLVMYITHDLTQRGMLLFTFLHLGSVIYNETDGEGWCFTAYCNATCKIEKQSRPCQTTIAPLFSSLKTTTPTIILSSTSETKSSATTTTSIPTTTTYEPDCNKFNPPRKVIIYHKMNEYHNASKFHPPSIRGAALEYLLKKCDTWGCWEALF